MGDSFGRSNGFASVDETYVLRISIWFLSKSVLHQVYISSDRQVLPQTML